MHPVLKRILVNSAITSVILAAAGVVVIHLTSAMIDAGNVRAGSQESHSAAMETYQYRAPLVMAFWGCVIVTVCELVLWRVRGVKAMVKPAPQPDEAEKLLNELLAQAEAAQHSGMDEKV